MGRSNMVYPRNTRRGIQIEKSTVEIYGGFLKWGSAPPQKNGMILASPHLSYSLKNTPTCSHRAHGYCRVGNLRRGIQTSADVKHGKLSLSGHKFDPYPKQLNISYPIFKLNLEDIKYSSILLIYVNIILIYIPCVSISLKQ